MTDYCGMTTLADFDRVIQFVVLSVVITKNQLKKKYIHYFPYYAK